MAALTVADLSDPEGEGPTATIAALKALQKQIGRLDRDRYAALSRAALLRQEIAEFEAALEEQASRTTAPIHELRRKTAARQPAGKAKPRAAPGAGKRKQQSA